ncbi:MAG TPA: M48 family metalloprotease [Candidatus Lokiarchaeia archaeon]|nr:M48 family metalloprotease [Candidatus Lokiarchaeia archaeon]
MGFKTRSTIAIIFLFLVLVGVILLPVIVFTYFFGTLDGAYLSLAIVLFIIPITFLLFLINYAIGPLLVGWLYRVNFISPEQLYNQYPRIAAMLDDFRENNKQIRKGPKFGIIFDGNPNAFAYGWSQNTARVVITQGLLEICDQDEALAVVAHELGHVRNRDMVVVTFISLVPMICYMIAQVFLRLGAYSAIVTPPVRTRGGRGSSNGGAIAAAMLIIGAIAYFLYWVTFFTCLFVSRMREYMADQHSAQFMHNPNLLASALVKIAYGLVKPKSSVGQDGMYTSKDLKVAQQAQNTKATTLKTLGIFDAKVAQGLAISATNPQGEFSPEAVSRVAAWDLRNPWARVYEVQSTHPLPAKRIIALNRQAVEQGYQPAIPLAEVDEYADKQGAKRMGGEFLADVIVYAGPTLVFLAMIGLIFTWAISSLLAIPITVFGFDLGSLDPLMLLVWGLVLIGIAKIGKTAYKYGGGSLYQETTVMNLLGEIHVSPVRPVRAMLSGRVIGRGIPGYVFSQDFVIQDRTGFMRLDYNFGFGIGNFLFSIFRTGRLIGHAIQVYGWYRRGPSPYLQIKQVIAADGHSNRCYADIFAYIGAVIWILLGLGLWYLFFVYAA